MDTESPVVWPAWCYSGDTTPTTDTTLETQTPSAKPSRRRRLDRTNNASLNNNNNNNGQMPDFTLNNNNNNNTTSNNNNNHVKNERLSPGTPDNSSGSRSVTPSSASHPDTPPAPENNPMLASLPGRNYSDFMRSLAAKYNNTGSNDYFTAVRNGFPPPLDPRFKPTAFTNIMQNLPTTSKDENSKKPDFSTIFPPFAANPLLPPLIDMSSTQALLAMMRTAKESELQGLLKNVKRQETSSPLDLSAAAPPTKRARTKAPSAGSNGGSSLVNHKRDQSESPRLQSEDISSWTVDDVCNFVSSIDICAEYAQNFRDQRIDGAGLPLLTEEHLTTTINMKLGPALKLKSILAKKLGSYVCYLCSNCHNSSNSPEHANNTGNTSDSGGGIS
ncbi:hypothetical protein Trydic_g4959 [Trypoxylus dichotomus]